MPACPHPGSRAPLGLSLDIHSDGTALGSGGAAVTPGPPYSQGRRPPPSAAVGDKGAVLIGLNLRGPIPRTGGDGGGGAGARLGLTGWVPRRQLQPRSPVSSNSGVSFCPHVKYDLLGI